MRINLEYNAINNFSSIILLEEDKKDLNLTEGQIDDNKIKLNISQKEKEKNYDDDADELRQATNWNRAFEKIYTQIKWLNAYAIIN
jgi:hypothetical protein